MASGLGDTDSEDELPHGWEERTTPEGWVYYANHMSKTTRWEHPKTNKRRRVPKDLPYGWERREDEKGRPYYVDHTSQKTTYTDPRLAFAVDVDSRNGDTIRQRFDASSTTEEILRGSDLTGKVAIVTGASAGIGLETARALAYHGAKVILACRNILKTEEAINNITKNRADVNVVAMKLDLASLKSVRAFTDKFLAAGWPLHMLILNAGVFQLPWQLTEDGIERTFATNHVGHFYLTQLLTPLLKDSAPARVVVVSSESHRFLLGDDHLSLSKLSPPQSQFWPMLQYNRTKLCNVLFSKELNRRLGGCGITCTSLHPGNMIYTSLPDSSWLYKTFYFMARPFTKSLEQGAACTIYAAVAPELQGHGGLYLNNCFPCEPSVISSDPAKAEELWQITEDLIRQRSGASPLNNMTDIESDNYVDLKRLDRELNIDITMNS